MSSRERCSRSARSYGGNAAPPPRASPCAEHSTSPAHAEPVLSQSAPSTSCANGGRPRRDRFTGRDALTATEQRVAQLAIEGLTNRQIAETLFITRKTVESHLEHTYRKLSIHARTELAEALLSQSENASVD